ncbi:MAG: GAF domain-containing protein [Phormidesmis sp.]
MRVMIVESDRAIIHTLTSLFSSHGYKVDICGDREACLKAASVNDHHRSDDSYDLIVLGAAFAEIDGASETTLSQRLHHQRRESGSQIPILSLIAREKLTQGIASIDTGGAGINDYVTMPFDAEELMARVTFLLHRSEQIKRLKQTASSQTDSSQTDFSQTERQLQRQLDRERLIIQVTDSIRQTLDLNQILRTAVDQVRRFLQTDRVVVFRFESNWQGVVEAESVAPGWIETLAIKIQDACLGKVYVGDYRQGRVSAISDIRDPSVDPYHRDLLISLQVQANLVVPILQGEELWGLLIAHHCRGPRQWKAESTQLLKQIAAHMAIAIQQAELYQKTCEQAALIDIATDAIFVRDLAGHIVFWSQGAERLYGWQAEEVMGKIAQQVLKKRKEDELEIALRTTIEKGFWQGELTQSTKVGDIILVASRWTLVKDSLGRPQSLLEVNTDITAQKQLEAQFYQAKRLESLGRLASGIAHDLGNILTPILAIAQMLRLTQADANAATKGQLDILESSARRGADMVRQILTFAQGNPGNETAVDIVALLQEVIDIIKQGFPASIEVRQINGLTAQQQDNLQASQPKQSDLLPRFVSADSTQLHQVFMNLCINARDAMPEGGILTLSIEDCFVDEAIAQQHLNVSVGHYVVVSVADTGTGIRPEVRDHIFDPFFTTKAADKGTGLGLATASGIISRANGFLSVSSEVDCGTEIEVYLPRLA